MNNIGKLKIKRNRPLFAVGVLIALIAVSVLIYAMRSSVEQSVYKERKNLLGNITESSAEVVNESLNYMQALADLNTASAQRELPYCETLETYLAEDFTPVGYESLLFFVDSNGRYYSSDGVYGKVVDREYFTASSEDRVSYISSLPHLDTSTQYLIYRNRFSKPVSVATAHGEAELLYCGLLYNISMLNDLFSQDFIGESNTFIYNSSTGVMLYENFGIRMLIDGYNIYPKFALSNPLYGESPESLKQSCRERETLVVALSIDGKEYYFCSAPVNHFEWSVAFIIQSEYLDNISGSAFGKIILFISLIAAVLGTVLVLLAVFFYRNAISEKSLREITALNTQLNAATRAKSDFLSNMSHDIRTPINGIMGMTAIAKGVPGNPEKTAECLNKIDGASKHLLSLVNDVLDMSRIERGATKIAANPINLRSVCDNCVAIIRGQMENRNLTLNTEFDLEHPEVIGDDLHLRQVLINILGNAVKFTPDGGTITFRCRETASDDTTAACVFEVEDTGIGMKPEFIGKIFDAFSQDEGGARSEYKGTGLGMSISKQLVDLMGGTITVESELGVGSHFTVTVSLPINTQPAPEKLIAPEDADITGFKILLVEDNELNMEIASELLGDVGAVITEARDGQEAVDTFSQNPPGTFDVILMDIMMPVLNGLEAAEQIRALPRKDAAEIPILAMTANAFDSDIRAAEAAGMNAHLSKPINLQEVIHTVAYFVRKQRGEL